jgi:hypothetical protein
MLEIELCKGKGKAIIDKKFSDVVAGKVYYLSAGGYAIRRIKTNKKWKLILLHREIIDASDKDGNKTRFINGNKLDCRLENMEVK